MTDLERFFRRLVQNLAASEPARLHHAIPLGEIYTSIIPYRTNRRALDLDTSEDYELVLMRLCAGEGGFARIGPEEARSRLERELASPNPDLDVLRQFEDALVSFAPRRIAWALEPVEDVTPEQITMPWPAVQPADEPAPPPPPAPGVTACVACGAALPENRPVTFCPSCGQSQSAPRCSGCGVELERDWRFCVACGEPVRA